MKKNYISFLFLIAFAGAVYAQELPAFSSMDVFELEWVNNPQISPDGQYIVYERRGMDIMKDKRSSRIWLIAADGQGHHKLSNADVRETQACWSPDGQRIAYVSATDQGAEIFIYWMNTGKTARISQLHNSPGNLSWSPDGKQLAFTMFVDGSELSLVKGPEKPKDAKWAERPRVTTRFKHERDGSGKMKPGFTHIFIIPAEGGTARQISQGNFNHGAPVWANDSKFLFFSANLSEDWEYDFRNSELYKINIADGKVSQLTDRNGPDHGLALSPDGKTIAYLGYDDKVQTYQITRLYTADSNGNNKKEVKLNLDRSISNLAWAADGKGIYFQYDDKGNTKIGYTAFDGKVQKLSDNVGGTGVARPYGGGSFSLAQNDAIAFTHTTPYHPSELAIHSNGKTKLVMSLNDDILKQRSLGKVEEIWYKSSVDQRDIQGWIVKPPFFDSSKKYPLLVENHGGPIANYGDRFSPEMQLYASAGYVVFYPNPRGSTSYGEEFGNLLYHNYPGEDYNDVMDGVDAILKKGYTSEDSLFVTGGSAGGIMTAWMIGKNNRFRSAAVIKPVMNWISKTLTADNYYYYAYSRYPGQPWENYQDYWKFSPISLVGNIQTPTLVMVGSNDLRTPLSEAKQLYHALKIRKIDTALVEMPGASHFIANRPSQLIAKIEYILAWFERSR